MKPQTMKTFKSVLLSTALVAVLSLPLATHAQTNGPVLNTNSPDGGITFPAGSPEAQAAAVLANVPTKSFADAKLEVNVGVVMHGSTSFANSLSLDYNFTTNFFVGAEEQNGPATSVISQIAIDFGYRYVVNNTLELYAKALLERNFTTDTWQGEIAAGVAWIPLSTSSTAVLNRTALFLEQRIVIDKTAFGGTSQGASTTTVGGVRFPF